LILSTSIINKKRSIKKKIYREAREPASQNPIYTKKINGLKCHYPHLAGRRRVYRNLWQLYCHYIEEHENQKEDYRKFILQLANLVIKKVII